MSILAVDDDPTILELLQVALGIHGYSNVSTCESGADAIEMLTQPETRYDAILLDIQMPKMDGIELCQRIRAMSKFRHTPILMVTAMSDKKYVNQAFAAGANDFVNKPFDVTELGTRLQTNIQLKEARDKIERLEVDNSSPSQLLTSIDTVKDRLTLENYLKQLSRCAAPHAIAGIKIANVSSLQISLSKSSFEDLLCALAKVIENQMDGGSSLCGYVAHGTFVCIYQGSHNRFDGFMRASLEDALNRHPWRNVETSDSAKVVIGDIVRCRRFRDVDAQGAIDHAITSVQAATHRSEQVIIDAENFRQTG